MNEDGWKYPWSESRNQLLYVVYKIIGHTGPVLLNFYLIPKKKLMYDVSFDLIYWFFSSSATVLSIFFTKKQKRVSLLTIKEEVGLGQQIHTILIAP